MFFCFISHITMSTESELLIKEYSKNPINNFKMKDATIHQHEGNFICWDDIIVYLKIEGDKIKEYSFDGNCSAITTAGASYLSELIIDKNIQDILTRNYQTMLDNWFEVSPRRKRAAVIAILATRNAIHNHLKDGKIDTFDDLIE